MKKETIKVLTLLVAASSLVASCKLGDIDYTVTPDPLEMHGDEVRVKIEVKVPEKGLPKKLAAEVVPMIGNTALKPVRIQGEKATGNGDVIQYKAGGMVTYEDVVPYTPDMEACDVTVTGKVFKGEKEKDEIPQTKIADATIITPYLVKKDFKVIIAEDNFQRVTQENLLTVINFDKGRSVVKSSEMRDEDVKEYQAFLADAQENPKVEVKAVNVTGFASPEGEEDKNNTLSTDRAEAGKATSAKIAKKAEHEAASEENFNGSITGSGEDYPGFKRELEADTEMNKDEKDLVLRILSTESDPVKREQAMRDLGKSFTYLDRNIFPKLRRAEINTVYDLTGFSDEEMKKYSVENPDTLDIEELLFCAQLYTDLNEQLRVYKLAEEKFPQDYRGANNVGTVLYKMNKIADAKAKFEKANGIQDNPISKNNLGAVAGATGDRETASELFGQANGAGSKGEVNYNKGILAIQNGEYSDAIGLLGGDNSFNKALAQLLDGSASTAVSTVDGSDDAETGLGYYLKAIAAARQDDLQGIVSNLKSAISKDGSLKEKAAKDREFIKYLDNASFTAIVK